MNSQTFDPELQIASFGIAEDPDAAARRKRARFFAIGVSVFAVVAGVMISRASAETPAPKPAEAKPAVVAAAPQPEAKPAAPPAVVEPPKAEAKVEAPTAAEEKPKSKSAKRGKHHAKH